MDGQRCAVLRKVQKHNPKFKTTEKSFTTGFQNLRYLLSSVKQEHRAEEPMGRGTRATSATGVKSTARGGGVRWAATFRIKLNRNRGVQETNSNDYLQNGCVGFFSTCICLMNI